MSTYLIKGSGFRIHAAVSGNSSFYNKNVIATIGDSRMMDGFNAKYTNRLNNSELFIYNLAFNGLDITDSIDIVSVFIKNCNCNLKRLIINAGSLSNTNKDPSEVQVFTAGYNPELIENIRDNIGFKYSLKLFPLLHFNNEIFLRSIYYKIFNKDDQSHGNSYSFRVPNNSEERLQRTAIVSNINYKELLRLNNILSENNTELIIVITPRHKIFTKNKRGYDIYVEAVKSRMQLLGLDFYDHSQLYSNNNEYFSDFIHLNTNGQLMYSKYLHYSGFFN